MIIGAILETANSDGGGQTDTLNGAAMMQFYTMDSAENWAIEQSKAVVYGASNVRVNTLCTVYNTETGIKRWWYRGIEYTG